MVELHDRMPVLVEPTGLDLWIGEMEGEPAKLLKPARDDVLRVWPVSKQVNGPGNNGADLLEAVGRRLAESALPAGLSQTFKHVFVVPGSVPWRSMADVEFEEVSSASSMAIRSACSASSARPSCPSAAASQR